MRIGTRGSALALAQARQVAELLGVEELVIVKVSGDASGEPGARGEDPEAATPRARLTAQASRGQIAPHAKRAPADKSRWVAELEQALLAGEIDLAVHSAKDVPAVLGAGLELLGAPARAPVEDVLVGADSLDELAQGACVGTSSVRRCAQLRAARPDLRVVSLHGNVDTRLGKLTSDAHQQALDAIVLASAGLHRLGREREIGCVLEAERFVPAPGQGALALQARSADETVRRAVAPLLDRDTSACLLAERALAQALQASCNTPLGAHAKPLAGAGMQLRAWIGMPDGSQWLADELVGELHEPRELARQMAERLETVGARELLQRAQQAHVE